MDLRVNSSRPNFGMAVYIDKSADKVIKEQLSKCPQKRVNAFWNKMHSVIENQENNKNDIFVRAAKHRDALVAEVKDAKGELNPYKTSQGLIHRNGSVKFINRAEQKANRFEELNKELDNVPRKKEQSYEEVDDFVYEAEEV